MGTRSSLRLSLLCLGVFTAVLVSLQLYFAIIDEEDSIPFSQAEFIHNAENIAGEEPARNDATKTSDNDDVILKGELVDEKWVEEKDEPMHFQYGEDQNIIREYLPEEDQYEYARDNNLPIILWWTHFIGSDAVRKCDVGECFLTENRTLQNHERTKAFLFYGTDFDANDLPLPRKADHEWGLLHEESPKNNAILSHEDTIVLFNHTSTFRRHSDYPLTTQFLESIDVLEKEPMHSLEEKTADQERASIVYVQSGCNPPSDRDAYVQELMKYIKVDCLGRCLNNKDLPDEYKDPLTFENKGFHKIVAKYKFTLVFENAICDDYLTEKIWRPLEIGSVPIYRGSMSILDWMPNNHSIILVDDFSNPKELAEFIRKVDTANDSVYLKYLEFKKKGAVTNKMLREHMEHRPWGITDKQVSFVNGFECFVCDRLHRNLKRQKDGLPIIKHVANQDHYSCPRPVLFDLPPPKGTEQFERDYWPQEYDRYIPIAKKMNNAVLSGHATFKSTD